MDKFDIRIEGPFEYKQTDGPFDIEDLVESWPEYLINFESTFMLFLFDSEGNLLRQEAGVGEEAMARGWVTIKEWNTWIAEHKPFTFGSTPPDINVPEQGKKENT